MSIYNISTIDLNLRLLSGYKFNVGAIEINPLKLKQIIDFGYIRYSECLNLITAKVEDFFEEGQNIDLPKDFTTFDLIISSGNENLISTFVDGLKLFLDEDDFYFENDLGLIFGEIKDRIEDCKIVNKDNFHEISEIIKYQNCVKSPEEDRFNPRDEQTRAIIEKLKKGKKLVQEKKQRENDDSGIDFVSIVSSVSAKSNNISKFNVWDLNIYQIYDEYRRLETIVGYETSVLAMVNGADIKNLKHWSSRFDAN
jgi:hypothetical protein